MTTKRKRLFAIFLLALHQITATVSIASECRDIELQAHRGSFKYPENTTEGVIQAFKDQFETVEIDIQQLRDGPWVLHHDLFTGRAVKIPKLALWHLPASEITASQWRSGQMLDRDKKPTMFNPSFLVDTLSKADSYLKSGKKLNIEIKGSYPCSVVTLIFGALKNTDPKSYFFSAVDPQVLSCIRRINKTVYLGLIVAPEPDSFLAGPNSAALLGAYRSQTERMSKYNPFKLYDKFGNRDLMTKAGLADLALHGINGIHTDVQFLIEKPDTLRWIKERRMKVYTYGVGPDPQHIEKVASLFNATKLKPNGMIINGDAAQTCDALRRAGIVD